jgi:hypothetical protein
MQIIDNTALRFVTNESAAQQISSALERSQIISNLPNGRELIIGWDHHEASYVAANTNLDVPRRYCVTTTGREDSLRLTIRRRQRRFCRCVAVPSVSTKQAQAKPPLLSGLRTI